VGEGLVEDLGAELVGEEEEVVGWGRGWGHGRDCGERVKGGPFLFVVVR
jgi:hypothetical protein